MQKNWLVATLDLLNQAAPVSSTLLGTPVTTGMYLVSAYLLITQPSNSNSTLGPVTLTYTEVETNLVKTLTLGFNDGTGAVVTTNTSNTLGALLTGTLVISAVAGTPVNVTAGYTSKGSTAMRYLVRFRSVLVTGLEVI